MTQKEAETQTSPLPNGTIGHVVYGGACGYKYSGRVSKYNDNRWRFPGGSSAGMVCFGSNGFKGGDGPSYKDKCVLEIDVR